MKETLEKNRRLSAAIIGGAGGAFIAMRHSDALHTSGTRQITCGALHQDQEIAMSAAKKWPYPIKGYPSYKALIADQKRLGPGKRIDFAVIAVPNFMHFPIARDFLKAGIPVVCEKPMTMTVNEAHHLADLVEANQIPFMVAHTYLGHWTSHFIRWLVTSGKLGNVRLLISEYDQGWLAKLIEALGQMQAWWRTNPKFAGASGCGGDILTHAMMQAVFTTGLPIETINLARFRTIVPGRKLDDDVFVEASLQNGATAIIRASQVRIGHLNDLRLEINGDRGSVVWRQEESEKVSVFLDGVNAELVYWRGNVSPKDKVLGHIPKALCSKTYWPSGHGEGLNMALRRLYDYFERDVRRFNAGLVPLHAGQEYAGVMEGLDHMRFLHAALKCAKTNRPSKPLC